VNQQNTKWKSNVSHEFGGKFEFTLLQMQRESFGNPSNQKTKTHPQDASEINFDVSHD
jgi:hypothetical protein